MAVHRWIATLVAVVVGISWLGASDRPTHSWLLFRGTPEQTGIAASRIPDKLEILWKFTAEDAFENAVAVSNGMVFAGSMDEHLYALDLETGKQRWKLKLAPIKAPPSVFQGQVFLGDLDGNFHCIDATRGVKKWSFETGAEVGGANFQGDSILFTSHDEHLYCLTSQGKLRWKFRTEGPIYGSTAVAEGRTFLVGCDSQMHVIDVTRGKELSSVDLDGQTGATAAVLGDMLYVGTMKNEVKAIDWKRSMVAWTFKPGRNAQAFYSSPAVTEKFVLIGSRDNRLHCIDRKTGKAAWSFLTGNKVDSSPVVAGNRVIVGSQDQKVYILDLETGKELQQLNLDGPINASPVVVNQRVVIGTQKGTLYCLGAR
ncbi:MAG: PQQ-binding-like beta-propeller repeat protein [Gemmataceae bacterium]